MERVHSKLHVYYSRRCFRFQRRGDGWRQRSDWNHGKKLKGAGERKQEHCLVHKSSRVYGYVNGEPVTLHSKCMGREELKRTTKENKPPIAARKYRSNPCRRERGDKTRKSKVNKSGNSKMPTDVWARAKCSLCHVFSTTKIIKFSAHRLKSEKFHGKIVDLYRCVQTLLWPSDRPNDSKRTLFRELGTSTVRFTVHGKMLTMSNIPLESGGWPCRPFHFQSLTH